jgi:phosphatidylinositol kinase/protein kinase (PI-3  family)
MVREKYPEKVPFRLTRMLIQAMEVSGIEGTFRITCENSMRVLRDNKESIMAVLEAFVHDPLINWRLINTGKLTSQEDWSLAKHSYPGRRAGGTTGGTADRGNRRAGVDEINPLDGKRNQRYTRFVALH